ncbi:DUF397 domain-containing protein [Nocardiopsis gilva YIM 90087]|uniref:DUF397 domain-containing protein n=1 Tax=Nocardiopsis gilva YIM 90087 TaxID=1235441 RepID=A0A223S5D6_9ACTN|nr:DUF397 domain-containing protein [Nocardiopsis gilva]ASU83335.1 DUF397 domain-containing protein [Nocardiopsis gilva YIM 90087]
MMSNKWNKSSYSTGGAANCVEARLDWHKSSYSNETGGDCVEIAEAWNKSSYSNSKGGNCVEVAETPHSILIRDTQNRPLGHLAFPGQEWAALLANAKAERL